jgi:hypothetical protein
MRKALAILIPVLLLFSSLGSGFCGAPRVSITLDKVNYAPLETVYASLLVQDEFNNALANQLVIIDWTEPSGNLIREDRPLTEASGTVQASLHLNVTSALGTYTVQATSSNSTATAYFQVKALRTYAVTIEMPILSVPIWVNGVQRSQGNTTFILAEGSYTLEVPSEYQGYTFKMWKTGTQNYTNPRLTISLDKQLTLTVVYEQGLTTQTVNWVLPYLLPIIGVIAVVVFLVWAYREGYFEGIL